VTEKESFRALTLGGLMSESLEANLRFHVVIFASFCNHGKRLNGTNPIKHFFSRKLNIGEK
jgi:hypothetical protein